MKMVERKHCDSCERRTPSRVRRGPDRDVPTKLREPLRLPFAVVLTRSSLVAAIWGINKQSVVSVRGSQMPGAVFIPLEDSPTGNRFASSRKANGEGSGSGYGEPGSPLMSRSSSSTSRSRPMYLLPRMLLVVLGIAAFSSFLVKKPTSSSRSFSTMKQALDLPVTEPYGDSSLVRAHSVWGSGTEGAIQHEWSIFYIDFTDEDGNNSTEAGRLHSDDDIVVTLTGPSLLSATVTYVDGGRYMARYRALDAGDYLLQINTFRRPPVYRGAYVFWLPLGNPEGYRITVLRSDGKRVKGDGRKSIEVPAAVCRNVAENAEGRWVRCEDVGLPCVRYGWIWMNRDCRYEVLSPAEITSKPLWILFLGTSVKRGTFFGAMDYLLGERAKDLPDTFFWKCKGWMDLRVDQFRISYRDFRRQCYSKPRQKICTTHNYEEAADEIMGRLGSENGGPDLVVLEVNDNYEGDFELLGTYRKMFGPSWTGQFLAAYRSQSPERNWTSVYPEWPQTLASDLISRPHWGIANFDLTVLSMPLFATMEFPLEKAATFHWHQPCRINGMRSCSVLADWEFQMIANYATHLPPRNKAPTISEDLKFCLHCPKGSDFTMKVDAPVQCFDELPMVRPPGKREVGL